jgi:hypothetical protein
MKKRRRKGLANLAGGRSWKLAVGGEERGMEKAKEQGGALLSCVAGSLFHVGDNISCRFASELRLSIHHRSNLE